MNQPAPTSTASTLLANPLLLWMTVQLIALAIGAAGLPLSARKQSPPEALSVQIMLVTQIGAAALLWPLMFANWRVAVAVIVTSLPFAQAAAFLSATPRDEMVAATGWMLVWLATLTLLPQCGQVLTTVLRSLVTIWSIGGAIATYLQADFALHPTVSLGPIVGTLSILQGDISGAKWVIASVLLLASLTLRLVCNAIRTPR